MEWKVSVFPEAKRKRRGNMKTETEICKMEMEMNFFMRKRKHKNGMVFSGGTDMETELTVSVNMEFPFLL